MLTYIGVISDGTSGKINVGYTVGVSSSDRIVSMASVGTVGNRSLEKRPGSVWDAKQRA